MGERESEKREKCALFESPVRNNCSEGLYLSITSALHCCAHVRECANSAMRLPLPPLIKLTLLSLWLHLFARLSLSSSR